MDMNGADASAAAGYNTTTPNWHYNGPAPFRRPRRSQLLADGNNGPRDIHMAESGCAPSLTAAETIGRDAVRAGDQRGRVGLRHAGRRRWPPGTSRPRRPTTRSCTT